MIRKIQAMSEVVQPFRIEIKEELIDDLLQRLSNARWPDQQTVSDWSQGVPEAELRELTEYWRTSYDWRRCEAMLNGYDQFHTDIDGVAIHFLHIRSPEPDAQPLLLTHGWPGSIIEFHKVIGPLTDPAAHGGDRRDAFHLIVPSLPGYGFSGKPTGTGWSVQRIADAWAELMQRLGYERWFAQGGDWGAVVTTALGAMRPQGLAGIHVNFPLVLPEGPHDQLSPEEARTMASLKEYKRTDAGYALQQATRPQTLGYALADSPIGQAAWIFEKFWAWSDCGGDPWTIFTKDEILDNIMLYWLTNSGASSARLYWESFSRGFNAVELNIPTGCSIFPKEIYRAPRSWAERCMHDLVYWNEPDRGGHFAAFEQPAIFVGELRDCFRMMR